MTFRASFRTLQTAIMLGAAMPLLAQGTSVPAAPQQSTQPVLTPEPSANDPAATIPMVAPPRAVPTLPPQPAPTVVKKKGPVDSLKPGQFVWEKRDVYAGPLKIVAVLDVQRIYVFQNDKLVGFSTISAGKKGKETPTGYFNILQKNIDHKSNLYSNAPMPYMQRLTWDGIALHGGHIPGYPASHGCIRLPHAFAKALYGVTQMDQEIVVLQNTATPIKRPEPKPVPVIDPPVMPPVEQPVAPPMTPTIDPAVTPPASPPKPVRLLMRSICLMLLTLLIAAVPAQANVYEPKELKSVKALKADEGVLRLSMRTQRQFIETAYLYFVEVLPNGIDGSRVLQFERGAGVPIMGTNMIDVKPKYYRVPAGKYRLLAYTVACAGLPPPGSVCTFYGNSLPTERYESGSPTIEVKQAALTDAGDFVIEYTKEVDLDNADLFDDRFADEGYGVRWRVIKEAVKSDFAALPAGPPPAVAPEFQSRIECDQRPKSRTVQFPFRCPAPTIDPAMTPAAASPKPVSN